MAKYNLIFPHFFGSSAGITERLSLREIDI